MSATLEAVGASVAPVFRGALGSGWRFEVYDRIAALDPALWRSVYSTHWKDERYYRTLEETFADDFDQRYLVLRDRAGERVRAIQPLFFVEQDLTVSLAAAWRALLRPLRALLNVRLLMVGCIVGDGQIGVPELADVPGVCAALSQALEVYARHERVSITVFKDFPAVYRDGLQAMTESGDYTRLPSLPGVRLLLDFANFEDYVQNRLGKATRKSLRRKFREVEALARPITLEVKTSITYGEAQALHSLYERVAQRGDVHFEVFSAEYFLKLGERMPEQTRYFMWRHAGRIVAFSFCTVHDGAIHDNDLGMDETVAASLHLYHVTFRDIVRWALAHGLTEYYSSPFNYDPKLHLRMELVPLDVYARHRSPWINTILGWLAPLVAPTRQEPLLDQFPNAARLWEGV